MSEQRGLLNKVQHFSLTNLESPSVLLLGPVRICRPTDLALQGPDTYSVITTS